MNLVRVLPLLWAICPANAYSLQPQVNKVRHPVQNVTCASDIAKSLLSEEITDLEEPFSLLRHQFELLRETPGEIIPEDPLFGTLESAGVASHDIDMTLIRFLRVARASLPKKERENAPRIADVALDRIKSTLRYRKEYDVLAFHAPGMARKLMYHDTNPGACMYLADAGTIDKKGQPVLVGRLGLMVAEDAEQHEPIVPANHLRAVMFVFERLASSLRLSKGQKRAIYILDCGMDKKSAPDLYDSVDSRPRHWSKFGRLAIEGLTMSGWKDKNKTPRIIPGVLPHLDKHNKIGQGLPVLREALRQLTQYYPDVMERVYFVRPPLSFRAFMKVFSLMVDKETAEKFIVIPAGSESKLLETLDVDQLPVEFGGKGPSLGRDDFLQTAFGRYEGESTGTMQKTEFAENRARYYDAATGVTASKDDAIRGGGRLVNGVGAKLFLSPEEDEPPLGEFMEQTQLVIAQNQEKRKRRLKLMWPLSGYVELDGIDDS